MSCVGRVCNIGSVCHASVVRGCVKNKKYPSASSSLIYHIWFLKHHHSAATPHHHNRWETQLSYPWKLQACRANSHYFIYFIFCSLYLLLFLIVLYRTIVTVYTDNIFLYNYLWQMHQIIHLSQVGCFTQARGKTVQKNREVSGVKKKCTENKNYIASLHFWGQIIKTLVKLLCSAPYISSYNIKATKCQQCCKSGSFKIYNFIIIIILESAVQGRERVRTLYLPKDPNPTQPTHGWKKKIKQ